MQKKIIGIKGMALAALLLLFASVCFAGAKISPEQAKASAVKKIAGKALSAKYEFEDGRWQYAVLVQRGSALYEVEINAQTGQVMDTERTSASEERSEAAADAKAARKTGMKTDGKTSH